MHRFNNILYVCQAAAAAAAQDSTIARVVSLAENNQAGLTVADVVPVVSAGIGMPPGGPISTDLQARLVSRRREALELLVEPYRKRLSIRVDVLVGTAFLEVIRAVLRHGHDLVFKTAEDPEWADRLFGSDDMHLLRKCPCPVWLMKPSEKLKYEHVMATVDFDPSKPETVAHGLNQEILDLSSSLALAELSALHLVHAWDAPAELLWRAWSDNPDEATMRYVEGERTRHQAGMDRLREALRARLGTDAYEYLAPRYHSIHGPPVTVIPEQAAHLRADLVVMGTVARTGIPGLIIGNTAEAVLDQLRCSVLALKPPGFVSPVRLTG